MPRPTMPGDEKPRGRRNPPKPLTTPQLISIEVEALLTELFLSEVRSGARP